MKHKPASTETDGQVHVLRGFGKRQQVVVESARAQHPRDLLHETSLANLVAHVGQRLRANLLRDWIERRSTRDRAVAQRFATGTTTGRQDR